MPTLIEITSFFTAVAVIGGLVWTIYSGRRSLNTANRSSTFSEAMQLLAAQREEAARLKAALLVEQRLRRRAERKAQRLLELYAKRVHLPVEWVELQMVDFDEADEGHDADAGAAAAEAAADTDERTRTARERHGHEHERPTRGSGGG